MSTWDALVSYNWINLGLYVYYNYIRLLVFNANKKDVRVCQKLHNGAILGNRIVRFTFDLTCFL